MPVNLIIRNPLDWDALAIARNANGANRRELSDYVRFLKSQAVWNDLGFFRDFANAKSLNHSFGPNISFTRGSIGTYFNANGVLQTAAANEPRFDHNPSTGASLGLLIEEARTNSIRNAQAGGATNGVIGSGGVMPTNWVGGSGNGVTQEIVGTGAEGGLSYIDVKFSGTPTVSSGSNVVFESPTHIVASNGQTWNSSAYVRLVAGTLANVTPKIVVSGRDAAGTQIGTQISSPTISPSSSSLASQRVSTSFTFSDAGVARVLPFVNIAYTSGNPIDLTLRIAAPQLEQGAFPTSYIPTTSAAATRAADSAVVTPISSFYNPSEGTLFAEASARNTSANLPCLISVDDTTANERLQLRRNMASSQPNVVISDGGTLQANIVTGTWTSDTVAQKLIAAYRADDIALSFNGAAPATDTSATMPTVTHMTFGIGPNSHNINGHIRKVAYWPKRLSNALLQQLTT